MRAPSDEPRRAARWVVMAVLVMVFGALVILTMANALTGKSAPSAWPAGWRCESFGKASATVCERDTQRKEGKVAP